MSCCWEKDKRYPGKIKSKANKLRVYLSALLSICKNSGGVLRGAFQQRCGRLCRREKRTVRHLKSSSCADGLSNLLFNACNAQKRRTGRVFGSYRPQKAAGRETGLSYLHGHSKQKETDSIYQVFLVRYQTPGLLDVEISCQGMCGIFLTGLYDSCQRLS